MTTFYISYGKNFNTWEKQNAVEYVDFVDGSLPDSFVIACKRGYAFCYEHFVNSWTSNYLVKFAPYKDEKACSALWDEWENFVDRSATA